MCREQLDVVGMSGPWLWGTCTTPPSSAGSSVTWDFLGLCLQERDDTPELSPGFMQKNPDFFLFFLFPIFSFFWMLFALLSGEHLRVVVSLSRVVLVEVSPKHN